MAAPQSAIFLPASAHLLTGKILNSNGVFSLAAGVPTNAITLALDNSATNLNWMMLRSLIVTSDDTAAHTVVFGVSPDNGTTFYPIGNIAIPITAGMHALGTTPTVDVLNNAEIPGLPFDNGANKSLVIPTGCLFMAGSLVAVTSGKAIYITGQVDVF